MRALVLLVALVACVAALVPSGTQRTDADAEFMPTVLWHGMGDTCCFPFSMGHIKRLIEKQLPGIYVYSIMVGNNIIEDEINGFLGNVNKQVEQVAQTLASDPNLANGFNAVGFSQGSQFLRAYVERFNGPKVNNLVTMGGQHQGVFGIPKCPADSRKFCEASRRLIDLGVYLPRVQNASVQAQYWQDPLNPEEYRAKNTFLPDINNDGSFNQTYKDNMMALSNFAMIQFTNDTMVQPIASEWFGFYAPGQDKTILPLEQSPLYLEDWLGLQKLDSAGRLQQLSCIGDHLQFTNEYFIDTVIPYLNVTM